MEMTVEQRTYFVRRLDEITKEKLEAKRTELFGDNPQGPQSPTWGEVFEAIRAGECTLKEDTVDLRRAYLNPDDVTWPRLEEIKAEYEANKAALAAYREQLQVERQKAMDAIMLDADAQQALATYAAV